MNIVNSPCSFISAYTLPLIGVHTIAKLFSTHHSAYLLCSLNVAFGLYLYNRNLKLYTVVSLYPVYLTPLRRGWWLSSVMHHESTGLDHLSFEVVMKYHNSLFWPSIVFSMVLLHFFAASKTGLWQIESKLLYPCFVWNITLAFIGTTWSNMNIGK